MFITPSFKKSLIIEQFQGNYLKGFKENKTPGEVGFTNVVNEGHVMRKSHDATQKKCPHVVHFNVPRDWFEINSRHQNRYSENGKKFRGCLPFGEKIRKLRCEVKW